jgi:polyhydroxyalkanoate synthesis regulator phasin
MTQEAWRAYLELAIGATDVTRKKATKAVRRLVGKGAVSAEQLQGMAEDLLRTSAASREAMAALVRTELERALSAVGLATADEVATLQAKVSDLEAQLKGQPPVGAAVVERTVTKRIVAKKTVAKKAAKKAAAAPVEPTFVPPPPPAPAAAEPLAPKAAKQAAKRATAVKKATTPAVAQAGQGPTAKAAAAKKAAPTKKAAVRRTRGNETS